MKTVTRPTTTELLECLRAHVVYTPTEAVIRELATGRELARIGRFADLHAAVFDLVQTQQKEALR